MAKKRTTTVNPPPVQVSRLSNFFSAHALSGLNPSKENFSFKALEGNDEFVRRMKTEGFAPTSAMNNIIRYVDEQTSAGQIYSPLFAFEAAKRERTVALTIMQLAIERIRQLQPELAKQLEAEAASKK